MVLNKQTTVEKEILQLKIDVEKFNTIISNINKEMNLVKEKIEQYKKNEELFKQVESLTQDKNDKQIELNRLDKQAKLDNDELLKLYVKFGSLTEKIASLEGTKKELENYSNLKDNLSIWLHWV